VSLSVFPKSNFGMSTSLPCGVVLGMHCLLQQLLVSDAAETEMPVQISFILHMVPPKAEHVFFSPLGIGLGCGFAQPINNKNKSNIARYLNFMLKKAFIPFIKLVVVSN